MQPLDIISLTVAAQGYFLLALMISLPYRPRVAKTLLQIFVAVKSTQMLVLYFLYESILPPEYVSAALNIGLMTGPLLYFYVKAMVSQDFRFHRSSFLHFLPVLAFPAILIANSGGVYPVAFPNLEPSWPLPLRLYNLLAQVWLMAYLLLSMRLLPHYEYFIRGHFSSISQFSFAWLYKVLAITLAIYVVLLLSRLWGWFFPEHIDFGWLTATQIAMQILFFYFIAVGGYYQRSAPDIAAPRIDIEQRYPLNNTAEDQNIGIMEEKYRRSSLSEVDAKSIWQRLTEHMYEHEPFLDNELRLAQLASALGVSTQSLSQVINTFSGQSFYDLINGFRARKAKQLLESPGYKSRSILDISMEAGFANKVTFYKHFKKHFNMNPSDYRKTSPKS